MVDINKKEKERRAKLMKAENERIARVNEAYRQKLMKEDPVKYEKDMDEAFERVFGKGYKRKSKNKSLLSR